MSDGSMQRFELTPAEQAAGDPWQDPRLVDADGYAELAGRFAGCTFDDGLYRLHDASSGPRSAALIADAFPDFAERVRPFGFDWLGRQFGVDANRVENSEPLVLMMEPGTGQALEIPFSFRSFHDHLDDLREPALAGSFFSAWRAMDPGHMPLSPDVCVGYRVPLFLGGVDDADNLEVIDMEVYWSICGQLRLGTRQLPAGTSIRQVTLG